MKMIFVYSGMKMITSKILVRMIVLVETCLIVFNKRFKIQTPNNFHNQIANLKILKKELLTKL